MGASFGYHDSGKAEDSMEVLTGEGTMLNVNAKN